MGKQMTEMLKGTLEGIVLALLTGKPAYGYEITTLLREQGFTEIAEGTVYALLVRIEQKGLVDVEKRPSEKGPPRKVYTLNAQGKRNSRSSGTPGAFCPNGLNSSARKKLTWQQSGSNWSPVRSNRRSSTGRTRRGPDALPEPYLTVVDGLQPVPHVLRRGHRRATTMVQMLDGSGRPLRQTRRHRRDARARDRRRRPGRVRRGLSPRHYAGKHWIDKERERLTQAIDKAERRRTHEQRCTARDHELRSTYRAWRSPTRICTCCAAWTSRWRRAASLPSSAPTEPGRPPW